MQSSPRPAPSEALRLSESCLEVCVLEDELRSCQHAADEAGLSVSEWARSRLVAVARYEELHHF